MAVITFGEHAIGGPDAVELGATIRTAIAEGATTVVLDLERVTVMNSAGLGMLVSALTTTQSAGASLLLGSVPAKVMDLLTMTQLSTVFEIHPTVDAAVASR